MINYIKGDLLGATQKVIIHGCNSMGVMGSGVAKLVRAKWTNVYEIYHLRYKTFGLEVGDIIPVATLDGKIVVNAITQKFYGRDSNTVYVDYNALAVCFIKLNDRALDWEVKEMALPKIGAGFANGDWAIIEEIINQSATNYTPIVYSID